jgi:hypothetical protein
MFRIEVKYSSGSHIPGNVLKGEIRISSSIGSLGKTEVRACISNRHASVLRFSADHPVSNRVHGSLVSV